MAGSRKALPNSPGQGTYHGIIPAGYNIVTLKPSGAIVSLLGLIECPEVEGAHQVAEGLKAKVVSADGSYLERFPEEFSFRITATLRKTLVTAPLDVVTTDSLPSDFLLELKFRLKSYDGLKVEEIQPQVVESIGVPSDVPYDERVFRIAFRVNDLPITSRVILYVSSPEDEPLAHFNFELL